MTAFAPSGTAPDIEAAGRSLRVAVVTNMWPNPTRPAFGIFVREQVESLRRRPGLDVGVFLLEPIDRRGRYLTGRRVATAIRGGGFDVVHCHHPFSLLALAPARRLLLETPVVLTVHGIEGVLGWRRLLTRRVARLADRIVVTNSLLNRMYGGELIPCGVDRRRFGPGPSRPPGGPVTVVTVGEDRPEKQFWLARGAVAWARAAGTGGAFGHRFVSDIPPERMPDAYRSADVLLVSSKAEGSPMVIQEARASGLRVVTTDVGDVQGMGGRSSGIHVAEAQTADALGRRLLEAVADVRGGRPFVAGFVDADEAAARLERVYRSLAAPAVAVSP